MTDINKDLAIAQIVSLMSSYSFDTNQRNPEELVQQWRKNYDVNWIYLATIEALYLGRYKAVSIEQIMHNWSRMGQANPHFGGDFERVISRKLPRHLVELNSTEKAKEQKSTQSNSQFESTENTNCQDTKAAKQKKPSHSDVTSGSTPIISTQVTPVPKSKLNSTSTSLTPSKDREDLLGDRCNGERGITTFEPRPDASGFFQKLKDLAYKQLKNKQQSSDKD